MRGFMRDLVQLYRSLPTWSWACMASGYLASQLLFDWQAFRRTPTVTSVGAQLLWTLLAFGVGLMWGTASRRRRR